MPIATVNQLYGRRWLGEEDSGWPPSVDGFDGVRQAAKELGQAGEGVDSRLHVFSPVFSLPPAVAAAHAAGNINSVTLRVWNINVGFNSATIFTGGTGYSEWSNLRNFSAEYVTEEDVLDGSTYGADDTSGNVIDSYDLMNLHTVDPEFGPDQDVFEFSQPLTGYSSWFDLPRFAFRVVVDGTPQERTTTFMGQSIDWTDGTFVTASYQLIIDYDETETPTVSLGATGTIILDGFVGEPPVILAATGTIILDGVVPELEFEPVAEAEVVVDFEAEIVVSVFIDSDMALPQRDVTNHTARDRRDS